MKALILLAVFLLGCESVPFQKDVRFIPSALANSPEFLVFIDGKVCRDMEGKAGLCAKRLKRDKSLSVYVPAKQYAYSAIFDCTDSVQTEPVKINVAEDKSATFVVSHLDYREAKIFNCSLLIKPLDRVQPIQSFARMTVTLIDADYIALEKPAWFSDGVVAGRFAQFVLYSQDGKWKRGKKKTVLRGKNIDYVYVESHNQRFSEGYGGK